MVTLPGSFLRNFCVGRFSCAQISCGQPAGGSPVLLFRWVQLLAGGDNFTRPRHMLFFLFFQLVKLRLILLNERTLIGCLNIT